MKYNTEILRSLADIGQNSWDQLKVNSCYMSYQWLEASETYFQPIIYYVTVKDDSHRIVAVAPCYFIAGPAINHRYNVCDLISGIHLIDEIKDHLPLEMQKEQLQRCSLIQEILGSQLFPYLLCTSLQGYVSSALFREDLSKDVTQSIADTLVNAIIQLGSNLDCQVTAFLYVRNSESIASLLSKREDLIQTVLEPSAYLQLPSGGFQDYLQLLSANRRRTVRREIRRFSDSGFAVTVHPLTELHTEQLARLFHNVQAKYELAGEPSADHAYIERLKRITLPTHVYVAEYENEPVAFSLFFQYKNVWHARIIGTNYILLPNNFCYFNISYYQPIIDAMRQDVHAIHYGVAALETKLTRGCTFEPTYGYFYLHSDVNNKLLRASADAVSLVRQMSQSTLLKIHGR